eukprot:1169000-Amphidinium_carterae.1
MQASLPWYLLIAPQSATCSVDETNTRVCLVNELELEQSIHVDGAREMASQEGSIRPEGRVRWGTCRQFWMRTCLPPQTLTFMWGVDTTHAILCPLKSETCTDSRRRLCMTSVDTSSYCIHPLSILQN